jgi:signal transduction histidine kinase
MEIIHDHDPAALAGRLAKHHAVSGAPMAELEWLARHGELRRYERGDVAASQNVDAPDLILVLAGCIAVTIQQGTGTRHTMESRAGGVTGVLPYSRMGRPLADAIATEPTEVLAVEKARIPEMIRECPTVTAIFVHVMLDRARRMTAANWQDEKMMSLGRLAAGLAHELNNPASAATRSAKRLRETTGELAEAARELGAATAGQPDESEIRAWIADIRLGASAALSAMERADREDEMSGWLAGRGLDVDQAASLVDAGLTPDSLAQLEKISGASRIPVVLRLVSAIAASGSLLDDVERSTTRVHDLVSAVRRFAWLDRSLANEPTFVGDGLTDTLAVWRSRAALKAIAVRLEVQPGLPTVIGNAGLLNQVWSNLIENAIDAAPSSGAVEVTARLEGGRIAVRFIDNGPGIPPDVQARMFDPFFTTKGVGQGIGLGLDIARRVVLMHEGGIEVRSQPGRTELLVTLPAET